MNAPASFRRFLPKLSLVLAGSFLLSSCASRVPGGGAFPDYSTAFLGPDGNIIIAGSPHRSARKPSDRPTPEPEWTWSGDGVPGAPSITINISTQTATFYKGGVEVGRAPVSTGREGYSTPTGRFSVIQKNADHVSNLYGDYVDSEGNVVKANVGVNRDKRPPGTRFRGAPMPHFMRVTGAVGMHAGYLPGYPASHGCIRLPRGAAAVFFENAPTGTPVLITH
jgi:hypothetical protein